jgi:hypothetical protein
MKAIFLCLILLNFLSCDQNSLENENSATKIISQLQGTQWKVKNIFLGDAITPPCYETTPRQGITLEFGKLDETAKNSLPISGKSTVNNYFTTFNFGEVIPDKNIVLMTLSALGSTKMAGPEDQQVCENTYYDLLRQSTGIQYDPAMPNTIHVGILKTTNTPSRDGGTYIIFERIK